MSEEDPPTEQMFCSNCGEEEKHEDLGLLPAYIVHGTGLVTKEETGWLQFYLCTDCGAFHTEPPSQDDVDKGVDLVVEALERHDLVGEEVVKDIG